LRFHLLVTCNADYDIFEGFKSDEKSIKVENFTLVQNTIMTPRLEIQKNCFIYLQCHL
jgi:hypothetical protein